jgi:hypothetical protein
MLSLAEAVYEQGRLDEAEQLAAAAEELRQEELPSVRAKVLASGGELVEAEAHRPSLGRARTAPSAPRQRLASATKADATDLA